MLYTSGTTGKSKGVVLSNRNIIEASKASASSTTCGKRRGSGLPADGLGRRFHLLHRAGLLDRVLRELPRKPGHDVREPARDRADLFLRAAALFRGTHHHPDDPDGGRQAPEAQHVPLLHGPRARWAEADGRQAGGLLGPAEILAGRHSGLWPARNRAGMSNVRVAYTAGEAIGPEIFEFWRSLGINLKQLYGQTEASVFITQQPDGEVRADTVGVPTPGVEVKIGENGEVYYRSPGTFVEYYKNPEAPPTPRTPRAGSPRATPAISRKKAASCASSTAPRTWARWPTAAVRAQIRREQAEVLSQHPRGRGLRQRARDVLRLHQHRPDGRRQLGGAQQHRLCVLPGAGGASAVMATIQSHVER
jgi:long-chain acyl-CoA synthetase